MLINFVDQTNVVNHYTTPPATGTLTGRRGRFHVVVGAGEELPSSAQLSVLWPGLLDMLPLWVEGAD